MNNWFALHNKSVQVCTFEFNCSKISGRIIFFLMAEEENFFSSTNLVSIEDNIYWSVEENRICEILGQNFYRFILKSVQKYPDLKKQVWKMQCFLDQNYKCLHHIAKAQGPSPIPNWVGSSRSVGRVCGGHDAWSPSSQQSIHGSPRPQHDFLETSINTCIFLIIPWCGTIHI